MLSDIPCCEVDLDDVTLLPEVLEELSELDDGGKAEEEVTKDDKDDNDSEVSSEPETAEDDKDTEREGDESKEGEESEADDDIDENEEDDDDTSQLEGSNSQLSLQPAISTPQEMSQASITSEKQVLLQTGLEGYSEEQKEETKEEVRLHSKLPFELMFETGGGLNELPLHTNREALTSTTLQADDECDTPTPSKRSDFTLEPAPVYNTEGKRTKVFKNTTLRTEARRMRTNVLALGSPIVTVTTDEPTQSMEAKTSPLPKLPECK